MKFVIYTILYSLLFIQFAWAEKIQVKGIVKEMGSRRLMKETKIFFLPEKVVAVTNEFGEFSVTLDDQKKWDVIVNLAGYKKFNESLKKPWSQLFADCNWLLVLDVNK